MEVFKRIEDARKKRNISQKEIYETMGITQQGYKSIVKGNPTIGSLEKIAKTLDCEVVELLPVNHPYFHYYDENNVWKGIGKEIEKD